MPFVIGENRKSITQVREFLQVQRTGSVQNIVNNSDIIFNTIQAGNIPYNTTTGVATLKAGKTYLISVSLSVASLENYIQVGIVDASNNSLIGQATEYLPNIVTIASTSSNKLEKIHTPVANQNVKARVTGTGLLALGADIRSDLQSSMTIIEL